MLSRIPVPAWLALGAVGIVGVVAINPTNLAPLLALVLGVPVVAYALRDYRLLWLAGVALMPISVELQRMGLIGGASMSFPTDLLGLALTGILIVKAGAFRGHWAGIIKHPLTLALGGYLGWMLLTCLPSSLPMVSVKFWLSTVWFAVPFFLFSILVMREGRRLTAWLALAGPALAVACLWTLGKQAAEGFTLASSYFNMRPFYNDHTVYAASLAMYAAGALLLALHTTAGGAVRRAEALYWWVLSAVLMVAIVASYTRGAWVGLFAAALVAVVLATWKRYKLVTLAGMGLLAAAVVVNLQLKQVNKAEQDRDSQSFEERLTSVFNVKTDISNKERFNRWVTAVWMIEDRPLFGYGPGTYAMNYGTYQRQRFMTPISTKRGDGGTAHNELLLAASEMGLPGALALLVLYGTIVYVGVRGFWDSRTRELKVLYLIPLCALITYLVHGLVNNYLDQDKVSIPTFCAMGMLVALDRYHRPRNPAPNTVRAHRLG